MASDPVINIEHVFKDFILPHEKVSSVKSAFTGIVRKKNKRSIEMQHALKDINFEIKQGEFFGIVGRNGSGKSTLLKIIAGIYQPTKGKVTTKGKLVPFIELGVGFNPELTGRENVYLNGAMLGFSKKEVDAMYGSIVEFAELERFMDQKLKNYSSGMQVRLAFSVAIRADADILIIDEVLAVGDAAFQRKCFNYFKKLKQQKKTVVLVTHEMSAVREYCDKAVLIEGSEVKVRGSAEKVANEYAKLFLEGGSSSDSLMNATETRWGEGKIKYDYIKIVSGSHEEKLIIDCALTSYADEEQKFSLGFRVRNEAGLDLFGTTTRLLDIRDMVIKPKERKEFRWEAPNILSDGRHALVNSIVSDDGIVQDYIEDKHFFEIRKTVLTAYPVQPPIEFIDRTAEGK